MLGDDNHGDFDDAQSVANMLSKLRDKKDRYLAGGPRKWFVMAGGTIFGLLLGTTIPGLIHTLMNAKYSR